MWPFKPKIVPTGHTIDMTRLGWAHNLSYVSEDGKSMKYAIWISTGPVVGDEMIWKSSSGQLVRSRVISVEPTQSVWDMSFIVVDNVRVDND